MFSVSPFFILADYEENHHWYVHPLVAQLEIQLLNPILTSLTLTILNSSPQAYLQPPRVPKPFIS